MSLVQILVLLGALLVAEAAPALPAGDAAWRFTAVVTLAVGVAFLAACGAWRTVRELSRPFAARARALIWFEAFQRWHLAAWAAMAAIDFGLLNWSAVVRYDAGLRGAVLLDEALLLAPLLGSLALSWAMFYDVDQTLRALAARRTGRDSPHWSRGGYVLFHFRGQLGLALIPLAAVIAIQDLFDVFTPGLETQPYGWLWIAGPALVALALLPEGLRRLWGAQRLPPGPLRTRLEAAAVRWGVRVRDIFIWPTQGSLLNAAVTGVVPHFRYVFLTDGLLEHLNDDEIESAFAHEMGHLRHHHLLLRAAAFLAPVALWLAASRWVDPSGWKTFFDGTAFSGWTQATATDLAGWRGASLLGLAAWAAYLVVVFGYYSRRLEEQADLFAARSTEVRHADEWAHVWPDAPPGYRAFLSTLDLLHGGNRRGFGWLHGSFASRAAFLERSLQRPEEAERFEGRLRRLAGMLLMVCLLGMAAAAWAG